MARDTSNVVLALLVAVLAGGLTAASCDAQRTTRAAIAALARSR